MRNGIVVAVALTCVAATAWAEPTREQLQARIERLEAENAKLREQVETMRAEIASLGEKAADEQRRAAIAEQRADEAARARRERFVERPQPEEGDESGLRTKPLKLDVTHGSRAEHYAQILALASGDGPLTLKLNAYGSAQNYKHLDSITLAIDGQPIELAIISYDSKRLGTGVRKSRRINRSNEFLELRLDRASLRKLAEANTVAGEVGPTRFVGGRDLIAACGALHEAMGHSTEAGKTGQ